MKKDLIIIVVMSVIIGTLYGKFIMGAFDSTSTSKNPLDQFKTEEVSKENQSSVTIYCLQAGVFSKEETMNEYVANYKALNIPSLKIVDTKNKTYKLYVGFVRDEKKLNHIKEILAQKNIDIYVKKETLGKEHPFVHFIDSVELVYTDQESVENVMNLQRVIITKYQELVVNESQS